MSTCVCVCLTVGTGNVVILGSALSFFLSSSRVLFLLTRRVKLRVCWRADGSDDWLDPHVKEKNQTCGFGTSGPSRRSSDVSPSGVGSNWERRSPEDCSVSPRSPTQPIKQGLMEPDGLKPVKKIQRSAAQTNQRRTGEIQTHKDTVRLQTFCLL